MLAKQKEQPNNIGVESGNFEQQLDHKKEKKNST